jgi:hypothetical protein
VPSRSLVVAAGFTTTTSAGRSIASRTIITVDLSGGLLSSYSVVLLVAFLLAFLASRRVMRSAYPQALRWPLAELAIKWLSSGSTFGEIGEERKASDRSLRVQDLERS